jgi:hypothetical protein
MVLRRWLVVLEVMVELGEAIGVSFGGWNLGILAALSSHHFFFGCEDLEDVSILFLRV